MSENTCYLCHESASVEEVEGEGGERLDVLCSAKCPRYEISRIAIKKLEGNPLRQGEAKEAIAKIKESGKYPVIRFDVRNDRFRYTAREDE